MKLLIALLCCLPLRLFSQSVSGIVLDTSRSPIIGATITDLDLHTKTLTDEKGQFLIKLANKSNHLSIAAVGYTTRKITVDTSKSLTIILQPSESILDEVQVIGYGTSTQRFNVGSVTKITAEDIEKQAISNPLEALQGRVPGLVIAASSGLPGSSFKVQIRGQNSLKSDVRNISALSDNPLFIIDGVPFAPQNNSVNQLRSVQSPLATLESGISPFNNISIADIESIEVLRDADATAIYGSRGGNGVILITTKTGKAGKTTFHTSANTGISRVGHTMRMMNTEEYIQMRREAIDNANSTPNLDLGDDGFAPDILLFDTTKYTDWKDFFMGGTAHATNINSTLSGGNELTQFRISGGYNKNTYVFPGNYADTKASFSSNIQHTSKNRKLKIGLSISYSYDKNNSSATPNLLKAYTMEPDFPDLLDKEGNPIWIVDGITLGSYSSPNPLRYLGTQYYLQNRNLIGHLQLSYQILKDLTISTGIGYNTYSSSEYASSPISADPVHETSNSASFGNNNFETWIIEPQLNYTRRIGRGVLKFLFGGTLQSDQHASRMTDAYGYINEGLMESISAAASSITNDSYSAYKYIAAFTRLNYVYDNKYILNLNGRRDGSSKFGPGRQFGNFGSVGAGWLFSEEDWLKDWGALSYGKLHGSYGITGTDYGLSNYQYLARWSPTNYSYNGSIGYLPLNLYNPLISWASTKKLEIGLELGFFKDRLLLAGTWFRNRSGNQLISYPLPSTAGFSIVSDNWDATVQNTGLEFSVQSTNIKTRSFSWTTGFNLSIPRNKLIAFPGIKTSSYSTTYKVGKSVNSIFGLKYAGVNPNTGLFEFYDINGEKTYTPSRRSGGEFNDYQYLGVSDPAYYGGLRNTIRYNGFQLGIFFNFNKEFAPTYFKDVYGQLPGMEFNLPAIMLSRWRKPGDQSEFQKLSTRNDETYDAKRFFSESNGVYANAFYVRLKTLSLSYSFGKQWLKSLKAESIQIYCHAQNLVTFSNYKGNDPETKTFYGVPIMKTIVLGLNFTF